MMHAVKPAASGTTKSVVALMLTFTAGYVDIVGYVAIYKLFVANMTGNTVHLASNFLHANWAEASLAGFVLLAFVAGSVSGRVIIELGARAGVRSVASITLLLEGVLIAAVLTLSLLGRTLPARDLLLMLAAAMGLQTASLTRVGPLSVHTTFVTGMINKFAQLFSHTILLGYDRLRGSREAPEQQRTAARESLFFASIWILYFLGALIGAGVHGKLGLQALRVPVVLIAAAIVVDQLRPLSLQEEQDQV
ncbi:MAG: DUF1275 domain-containing protein [Acidobacteria bacterium]|nr:DUF1275 domain-containing protein [Acidobacteriota bacterium]